MGPGPDRVRDLVRSSRVEESDLIPSLVDGTEGRTGEWEVGWRRDVGLL